MVSPRGCYANSSRPVRRDARWLARVFAHHVRIRSAATAPVSDRRCMSADRHLTRAQRGGPDHNHLQTSVVPYEGGARSVSGRPSLSSVNGSPLGGSLVVVDPFTLPVSVQDERAHIAAVLDTLIAFTTLWAGSEWSRGTPRPAQKKEQRAGVSRRDEAVTRARVG